MRWKAVRVTGARVMQPPSPMLLIIAVATFVGGIALIVFGAIVPTSALFVPGFLLLIAAVGIGLLALGRRGSQAPTHRT